MHKEAQQVAGGPTSLGATSEEGDHPQLSSGCDASADSTSEADPGISAPNDFIPEQQDNQICWSSVLKGSRRTKAQRAYGAFAGEGRSRAMNVKFEKKVSKSVTFPRRAKAQGSKSQGSALFVSLVHVVKLKTLQWELPTKFLGLPSQISSVQEKLKTLDALPSLLHKVTDTLNRFATIVENASTKATDKGVPSAGHASASPAEGEKNKNQATKDADNANLNQQPTTTTLPTTSSFQSPLFPKIKGKEIEEQKRIEESLKAELAKQEVERVKSELVDLIGIDVVTQYYNKKLMYDKYCDKVLKRKKSSKITNYDVLTTKGPITLKVYREDGTNEVISNLKVSDLHLAELREVVQACPNIKEKGWKTCYGLIKTRMEYLDQTKKELKIDFNRPLKEQDPLDELNDLANKKRKRVDDLKDHSMSTKKHKSLVQHEKEEEIVGLESLKKVQLQFFRYLEDQDHLHFSLCGGTDAEDKTLARASVQLG
ncbi:hypothetical protein Tco_0478476 [Tanacetum coccineum]